ncbi:MAG: hypothetical protein ACOX2F_06550 [bacterium]
MTIFEKRNISQKVVELIKKDVELYHLIQKILEAVEVNTNSLKNMARYLKEIKLREGLGYEKILENANFSNLLEKSELSEKTKGEELVNRLYNLRFPLWSAKKATFKKLTSQFRAATGGEIIFPDFAEGNSFKISFEIKNENDIQKIEETISKGKEILLDSLKELKK